MKNTNNTKIPFKYMLLGWVPTVLSLVIVMALMVPTILLVLPTGSLMCIVDGTSMDTTLHDGQYMFQNGTDFARGDIVTCTIPASEGSTETKILVKRIVGMPGDTVSIDQSGVYINGQLLSETYLTAGAVADTYRENLRNYTQLGPTEYFLMGDNRTVSYDSRYFGAIDHADMLYRVSAKPALPFFLAVGKLLIIAVAAFAVNDLLDKLLTRWFCKRFPQLAVYLDSRKQENGEAPEDTE